MSFSSSSSSSSSPSSSPRGMEEKTMRCQKCLEIGHWTYECKIGEKVYVERESYSPRASEEEEAKRERQGKINIEYMGRFAFYVVNFSLDIAQLTNTEACGYVSGDVCVTCGNDGVCSDHFYPNSGPFQSTPPSNSYCQDKKQFLKYNTNEPISEYRVGEWLIFCAVVSFFLLLLDTYNVYAHFMYVIDHEGYKYSIAANEEEKIRNTLMIQYFAKFIDTIEAVVQCSMFFYICPSVLDLISISFSTYLLTVSSLLMLLDKDRQKEKNPSVFMRNTTEVDGLKLLKYVNITILIVSIVLLVLNFVIVFILISYLIQGVKLDDSTDIDEESQTSYAVFVPFSFLINIPVMLVAAGFSQKLWNGQDLTECVEEEGVVPILLKYTKIALKYVTVGMEAKDKVYAEN